MDGNVPRRGIISVETGNTSPAHIRELRGTVQADADAVFGVFICLQPPTKPMKEAAFEAGSWVSEYDGKVYPVIQVLSARACSMACPCRCLARARRCSPKPSANGHAKASSASWARCSRPATPRAR